MVPKNAARRNKSNNDNKTLRKRSMRTKYGSLSLTMRICGAQRSHGEETNAFRTELCNFFFVCFNSQASPDSQIPAWTASSLEQPVLSNALFSWGIERFLCLLDFDFGPSWRFSNRQFTGGKSSLWLTNWTLMRPWIVGFASRYLAQAPEETVIWGRKSGQVYYAMLSDKFAGVNLRCGQKGLDE